MRSLESEYGKGEVVLRSNGSVGVEEAASAPVVVELARWGEGVLHDPMVVSESKRPRRWRYSPRGEPVLHDPMVVSASTRVSISVDESRLGAACEGPPRLGGASIQKVELAGTLQTAHGAHPAHGKQGAREDVRLLPAVGGGVALEPNVVYGKRPRDHGHGRDRGKALQRDGGELRRSAVARGGQRRVDDGRDEDGTGVDRVGGAVLGLVFRVVEVRKLGDGLYGRGGSGCRAAQGGRSKVLACDWGEKSRRGELSRN